MSTTTTTQELVHKTLVTRPTKKGETRYRWTISDSSIDRQRDTISIDGWDLRSYRKSPVVLWAHDYKSLPVGKSLATYVSNGKLIAEMEFVPPGLHPLADQLRGLIDANVPIGASIGMKAIEGRYNAKRDGTDFLKQELLEWSLVSIPANQNAVQQRCVGGRCDEQAVRKWLSGTSVKNSSRDGTSFSKPVPTQKNDDDVVTFELHDLKYALAEALRPAVQQAWRDAIMRRTGRVD